MFATSDGSYSSCALVLATASVRWLPWCAMWLCDRVFFELLMSASESSWTAEIRVKWHLVARIEHSIGAALCSLKKVKALDSCGASFSTDVGNKKRWSLKNKFFDGISSIREQKNAGFSRRRACWIFRRILQNKISDGFLNIREQKKPSEFSKRRACWIFDGSSSPPLIINKSLLLRLLCGRSAE